MPQEGNLEDLISEGWVTCQYCTLIHDELIAVDVGLDCIESCLHDPLLLESIQVDVDLVLIEGLLHHSKEVSQCGVLVLVLGEVQLHGLGEGLLTHHEVQLFDQRGTLGVRDTIKDILTLIGVVDLTINGVRGDQLIGHVSPNLAFVEGHPNVHSLYLLGIDLPCAKVRNELRKTLIEPQVVPPFHGHQIPEPHVTQFVQDRVLSICSLRHWNVLLEDVVIVDGHGTSILHSTG